MRGCVAAANEKPATDSSHLWLDTPSSQGRYSSDNGYLWVVATHVTVDCYCSAVAGIVCALQMTLSPVIQPICRTPITHMPDGKLHYIQEIPLILMTGAW